MKRQKQHLTLLSIIAVIIAIACGVVTVAPDLDQPGGVNTAAAMTWSVMESVAYLSATSTYTSAPASDTPTSTAIPTETRTSTPTETPIPPLTPIPTNTPAPTVTPIPTRVSGGGTGGGGGGGGGSYYPPCNAAEFIWNATIPNNSILPPSTTFTRVWRIENIGSCTWYPNTYRFVHVGGNSLGGSTVSIPYNVKPGDSVDIAVDMESPSAEGTYIGYWMLRERNQKPFGDYPRNDPFPIKIYVDSTPGGKIFDFANEYCQARWRSSTKFLSCPSNFGNRNGFVVRPSDPHLESGKEFDPGIWTHPPFIQFGWILGRFPAIYIQSGDHFVADIGCMYGYPKCNVQFELFYEYPFHNEVKLGEAHEIYDGSMTSVDFDLTPYAGDTISLIFKVTGLANTDQNSAIWFQPQIIHP